MHQGCKFDIWSGHMQKATSECVSGTITVSLKINLKNKAVALSRCLLDVEGGLRVLGLFFSARHLCFPAIC